MESVSEIRSTEERAAVLIERVELRLGMDGGEVEDGVLVGQRF